MSKPDPISRLIEACEAHEKLNRAQDLSWCYRSASGWEPDDDESDLVEWLQQRFEANRASRDAMLKAAAAAAPAIRSAGYDPATVFELIEILNSTQFGERLQKLRPNLRTCSALTETGESESGTEADDGMTANERMREAVDGDPRRIDWTAKEWAEFLGCSHHYVPDLPMWDQIRGMKKEERRRRTKQISET